MMKQITIKIAILILLIPALLLAEDNDILIRDIAGKIDSYRNKTITLKLRMKNLDEIFHKLTFYDRKNYDIVFDISELEKKDEFKLQMLNLHRGAEYIVKFTIKGRTDSEEIIADLIEFSPYLLLKLPEGINKTK